MRIIIGITIPLTANLDFMVSFYKNETTTFVYSKKCSILFYYVLDNFLKLTSDKDAVDFLFTSALMNKKIHLIKSSVWSSTVGFGYIS